MGVKRKEPTTQEAIDNLSIKVGEYNAKLKTQGGFDKVSGDENVLGIKATARYLELAIDPKLQTAAQKQFIKVNDDIQTDLDNAMQPFIDNPKKYMEEYPKAVDKILNALPAQTRQQIEQTVGETGLMIAKTRVNLANAKTDSIIPASMPETVTVATDTINRPADKIILS